MKNKNIKEKLQIIAAMIGKYEIEMEGARLKGDYDLYKLKRGAKEMAQVEFKKLSKKYAKSKLERI